MSEYEVVKVPGLTEMVFARERDGVVTLTYPTTLAANYMADILKELNLSCECKAAIGARPGFHYGSIYETLDTRRVTNKVTVVAWLQREPIHHGKP